MGNNAQLNEICNFIFIKSKEICYIYNILLLTCQYKFIIENYFVNYKMPFIKIMSPKIHCKNLHYLSSKVKTSRFVNSS